MPLTDFQHASLIALLGDEHLYAAKDRTVIAPADIAQLSAALCFAHQNGIPVLPIGGGTKWTWGNTASLGLVLSLHRMNQVKEHAWQDMTCTVQAGCTWSAMQAALSTHNQHVALDPLWPGTATVGGVIATNDSGALRLKYGGLRDLIIGMTVVLADGTVAKTGGKVVKNVAGYDLHKLMTGAFGTLGVIAEVNFRLHPMERTLQTWSITASDAFTLDKPLRAILDSQLAPVSVQVRCSPREAVLDIRLATSAAQRDGQRLALERIAGELSIAPAEETVWEERQKLANIFYESEGAALKVSLPHDEICNFLARVQHIPPEFRAHAVAQANGLLLLSLEGAPNALARMIRILQAEVAELGGSVFIQAMPPALHESMDAWGEPPATITLMREIKKQFDPNGTLNPGRFVGGI